MCLNSAYLKTKFWRKYLGLREKLIGNGGNYAMNNFIMCIFLNIKEVIMNYRPTCGADG